MGQYRMNRPLAEVRAERMGQLLEALRLEKAREMAADRATGSGRWMRTLPREERSAKARHAARARWAREAK